MATYQWSADDHTLDPIGNGWTLSSNALSSSSIVTTTTPLGTKAWRIEGQDKTELSYDAAGTTADGQVLLLLKVDPTGLEGTVSTLACGLVRNVDAFNHIYGGFRHMTEAEYPAIYTGPIRGIEDNGSFTGYVFQIGSQIDRLDADIMVSASDSLTCSVRGNPVNLYWAILSGTFSTTHSDFPLDYVSADGTTSSAPTGLGISTSSINATQLTTERDRWFPDDVVEVVYTAKTQALSHLQDELFRVFQAIPTVSPETRVSSVATCTRFARSSVRPVIRAAFL